MQGLEDLQIEAAAAGAATDTAQVMSQHKCSKPCQLMLRLLLLRLTPKKEGVTMRPFQPPPFGAAADAAATDTTAQVMSQCVCPKPCQLKLLLRLLLLLRLALRQKLSQCNRSKLPHLELLPLLQLGGLLLPLSCLGCQRFACLCSPVHPQQQEAVHARCSHRCLSICAATLSERLMLLAAMQLSCLSSAKHRHTCLSR